MKHFNVYVMAAVLLLSLPSIAQKNKNLNRNNQYNQLYVGDNLPMDQLNFTSLKNLNSKSLRLSAFQRKKLIILDFWTKSCSYCIESMPKMEDLQTKYDADIQILLVTPNNYQELLPLFKRSKILKNVKLPIIMSDTILYSKNFPHNANPYHVWLNGDGTILATTDGTETNEKTISEYLNTGKVKLINSIASVAGISDDIKSPSISLLRADTGKYVSNVIYMARSLPNRAQINNFKNNKDFYISIDNFLGSGEYSFLLNNRNIPRYFLSASGHHVELKEDGKSVGLKIFQCPLQYLIGYAYHDIVATEKSPFITFQINRAPSRYELLTDTTNMARFFMQHLYSYEVRTDNYSIEKGRKMLQIDIARGLGIKMRMDTAFIKCALLKIADEAKFSKCLANTTSESEHFVSRDKISFTNSSIAQLIGEYNQGLSGNTDVRLINETNQPENKRITLTLNNSNLKLSDNNIEKLNTELKQYGLIIKTEYRKLRVQIIENAY